MKLSLPLLVCGLLVGSSFTLRADEASHRAAAEALLQNMEMDKLMDQSVNAMLSAQAQQDPALARNQPQLKAFFAKYLSWASLKDDVVKLYVREFSEAELQELAAFYGTRLGKKMIAKMPTLMAQAASLGQQRVQEHLPELVSSLQGAPTPNGKR